MLHIINKNKQIRVSPMNRLLSAIVKNYKLRMLDRMIRNIKRIILEDCASVCEDDHTGDIRECDAIDCPLIKLRKEYEKREQNDTIDGVSVRAPLHEHNKGEPSAARCTR